MIDRASATLTSCATYALSAAVLVSASKRGLPPDGVGALNTRADVSD